MDAEQTALMAIEALREGLLAQAEQLSHRAYRTAPNSVRVLWAYGAVLQARGSFAEAARVFRRLGLLDPKAASHRMNLATCLRSMGEFDGALSAYAEAAALGEDSADFHYNLGLLHLDRGALNAACEALREASRRASRDAEIRFDYARACFLAVDTDATLEALRDWSTWSGLKADKLAATASLLLQMGEQADAERIIAMLDAMPQRPPEIELQIVGMLERVNRLDEAFRRFAALDARGGPAGEGFAQQRLAVHALLAHRRGDPEMAAQLYEQLAKDCSSEHERQRFLFPLAKVLDEQKRYDVAIQTLAEAHASQWAYAEFTRATLSEEERPIMAITAFGCEPSDAADWQEPAPPSISDSPIFIVAFPRSGTTLLEHMLDAHPLLQTMDEQPFLQKATLRFGDLGYDYPHDLKGMSSDDLAAIRRYYWDMVARKVKLKPRQRLIDKNPLNMLRLPAIQRLFPNAPILLAIRHPCDVIVSNYFQHYRAHEFVRLCRDLPTLALAYRKAFDYWYEQANILKPKAMEVRYESFVANFDASSREIADFIGIEWHDDMAKPAEHARAKGFISTPSYSQVVQPVNTNAVGRWRRYEAHMEPVIAEVQPYLKRWNYDS